MKRWDPGDQVVVREVWQGQVWTVRPPIVVRDARELVALYMPDGCPWLRPVDASGFYLRMPGGNWSLKEERLNIHHLSLAIPDEPYSVILMWEADWKLRCWYINLEEPIRRTDIGFDFIDQTLDIVISPGMTEWRWKDEDELEEALRRGLYSREQTLAIRAEGERALERLLSHEPPFDERWEDWRPEPTWEMPVIDGVWQLPDQK